MFIPAWLIILLTCTAGWGAIAWFIGDPNQDFFGIAGIVHILNIAFWVILLLSALLIRSWLA